MATDPDEKIHQTADILCDRLVNELERYGFDMTEGEFPGQVVPKEWTAWLERFHASLSEELREEVYTLFHRRRNERIQAYLTTMFGTAKEEEKVHYWTPKEDIIWKPTGIFTRITTSRGETLDTPIIGGYVKPVAVCDIEGEERIEFVGDGWATACTVPEMIKQLRDKGLVYDRRAEWVLSFVVGRMTSKKSIVHPVFGIFDDLYPEHLTINYNLHPLTEEQKLAAQEIQPNFKQMWKHRYIDAYCDFIFKFRPYEVRPIVGQAVMAPLGLVLKRHGYMLANIIDWTFTSDVGKNMKGQAFSTRWTGLSTVSGDTLESPFRLGAISDAACLLRNVNEVENCPQKVWSALKDAPESMVALRRGTASQGMNIYHARAVLDLTANRQMIRRPDLLKRFFVIHSCDDIATLERRWAKKERFEAVVADLKPIGFRGWEELLTWDMNHFYSLERLMAQIDAASAILGKISKADDHPLGAARCDAWAVNLIGNQAFDFLAREVCEAPHLRLTPEAFYSEVIKPIEVPMKETARDPIEVFLSWFGGYRIDHTKTRRANDGSGSFDLEYVLGEGVLFESCGGDVTLGLPPGWWIVEELLQRHNKMNTGFQFGSLKELTLQGANFAGIDPKLVLGADGKTKAHRFEKAGVAKAGWVPKSSISPRERPEPPEGERGGTAYCEDDLEDWELEEAEEYG